ncbi:dCTP deaminase [Stenotrophomonas sp. NPDC087984]
MLSATSIIRLTSQGALGWQGHLRGDGLLLTLGALLQPLTAARSGVVDLADQSSIDSLYGEPITEWASYELPPGEMLLGAVEEPLRLGAGLMGMTGGLSHLARVGLAVHVTSPFVLPGWNGHLTLELVNTSPAVLRLHQGMPLARLLVFTLEGSRTGGPSSHPFYGRQTDLKSRYADEFAVGEIRR